MKPVRSDLELNRLYRRAAHEQAPASIDTRVFAAAQSHARRARWARRSVWLLPVAVAVLMLWPGASLKRPLTPRAVSTARLLREELMRVGTPKPVMASDRANWLLDTSPYADKPSDAGGARVAEENSP